MHGSLKWGMKDIGLWLNLLLSQKQFSKQSIPVVGQLHKGLCFNFNEGHCKLHHNCKYRHECAHYNGAHPAISCFKKMAPTTVPTTKDPFLKSGNAGEIGNIFTRASPLSRSHSSGHSN